MKFVRMTALLALRALRRNKTRTALTTLGIVIGVSAVIAMVAVGQGASAAVRQQVSTLGSNVIMVMPGATTAAGVRSGWGGASTLTVGDAQAVLREVPAAAHVTYFVRQVGQVVSGSQNWSTALMGASPTFAVVRDWTIGSGAFFSERDERIAAKVCVIGNTVAQNLFGAGQDPVGAIVRVQNVPLRVIGVFAPKGQSMFGQDQDDLLVMPFSTAERRVLGSSILGVVNQIFVKAVSPDAVESAAEAVRALLRQRHRISAGQEDDFTVRNVADIAEVLSQTSTTMTWLLGGVAGVSLLVGGIGIMNILLVSVVERTREIGIRLAVGAKARHILAQFLVEAAVLSMAGGVFGVVLGLGAARTIAALASWPVVISPLAIAGAFLFSGAVGLFFGIYPARRAARLDPIEALRWE